jgi:hypothetical protein
MRLCDLFMQARNDNHRQEMLQEVMLHETAVSWMRHRLTISTPINAATETREEYVSRLKRVCAEINANYDVEGLSRAFPSRVQAVKDAGGDRIAK